MLTRKKRLEVWWLTLLLNFGAYNKYPKLCQEADAHDHLYSAERQKKAANNYYIKLADEGVNTTEGTKFSSDQWACLKDSILQTMQYKEQAEHLD